MQRLHGVHSTVYYYCVAPTYLGLAVFYLSRHRLRSASQSTPLVHILHIRRRSVLDDHLPSAAHDAATFRQRLKKLRLVLASALTNHIFAYPLIQITYNFRFRQCRPYKVRPSEQCYFSYNFSVIVKL